MSQITARPADPRSGREGSGEVIVKFRKGEQAGGRWPSSCLYSRVLSQKATLTLPPTLQGMHGSVSLS
jgi:hypothetical protein